MNRRQKRLTIIAVAAAVIIALIIFLYAFPGESGLIVKAVNTARSETPYGEYLEIKLDTTARTQQASWHAATASASQNVWTVNGTYKSQGQVTLGYSLTVTYANVQNIQLVSLYIKAVDNADSSSYTYTLASNKPLSGSSPISDSGSTQKTISQHLSDCQASSTGATIKYYIYCKVQATGSISGQTLVAEITETWFTTLVYSQHTESTSANVTPSVTVSSWLDFLDRNSDIIVAAAIMAIGCIVVYAILKPRKRKR